MSDFRSRVLGTIIGILSRGSFPKWEPVAFLYGHVAQEGETPTQIINGVGYVGVVAQKLPTELKYNTQGISFPYAIIREALVPAIAGNVYLDFCNAPLRKCIHEETGVELLRPDYDTYPSYYNYGVELKDSNVWEDMRPLPGITTNPALHSSKGGYLFSGDYQFFWTNHDILDENGKVFFPATDPIPVHRQVGFKYGNSEVLPEVPESDLPFSLVFKDNNTSDYYFVATEKAGEVYGTVLGQSSARIEITAHSFTHRWKTWKLSEGTTEWVEIRSSGVPTHENFLASWLIWTNHDIRYMSNSTTVEEDLRGTVYVGADPAPIPVYE